jgi:CubicO group peptidase (beta-lactamase class C family)
MERFPSFSRQCPIWPILLAMALVTGCAQVPTSPSIVAQGDYSPVAEYITALAKREMAAHDVVGLSIALVDDQRVVWAQGFGYADQANTVPATPETLFRLGSVSKVFTASAVMQLAEAGEVDIDRPLSSYLPEFKVRSRFANAPAITPRNLMTHHAGLPHDYAKGMWSAHAGHPSLLRDLRGQDLVYPPDFIFSYSNVGYGLLGALVERASGSGFAGHMDDSLLKPLGMAQSFFAAAPPASSRMSRSYRNGKEEADPPLRDVAAGGLISNVVDMSHFLSMVFADGKAHGNQVLQPGTVAAMLSPQNSKVELDRNFRVGLGWMLSSLGELDIEGAGPVIHHAGSTPLFHAQFAALPRHKVGVVVLANTASSEPTVNKLAAETLKLALRVKTGMTPSAPHPSRLREEPWSRDELSTLSGHFATLLGTISFAADGNELYAEALGKRFRILPRVDGQVAVRYYLLGLLPIGLDDLENFELSVARLGRRDMLIARHGAQEVVLGEKLAPAPAAKTWQDRTGVYVPINLDGDYPLVQSLRLTTEQGLAVLEVRLLESPDLPLRLALKPLSDGEALVLRTLSDMGETLRVKRNHDGSEFLEFSGYRYARRGEL